jgi:predicted ATPase/DNA-binding XRE family transcriptional regulator
MEFGELLRRHRRAAGLTQEELAERASLSLRGLSDLERGARRAPYPDTVRRLADALGLSERDRAALLAASSRHHALTPPSGPALPVWLSSFIGREREMSEVRRLLSSTRLVTLVGVGGVGKTRLALEAVRERQEAVFVDLASLADERLVPAAVAAAFGLRERPKQSPVQALMSHLATRDVVLVLDNCEHLISACAELVEHLLGGCPDLHVLATSREPVGVLGEQLWPVPPLAVPGPTDVDPGASEAVSLFTDRARLAWPDFTLDGQSGQVVAEICRRLDGLPLAIELAAARLPGLGLETLADRLDHRFSLLTLSSRTAPRRQQTLRAVIDWSYELLAEPEQRLFRRLGVFAGGWSLVMAEEVCTGDGLDAEQVLDVLSQLVQKSLVVLSDAAGEARYGLLETLRHYAAERLTEAGEDRVTRGRHVQWCVALAERADADKDGPRRASWLTSLEREHGNLRAALEASLADPGTSEAALRLAGALGWFWWMRGHAREGSQWMHRVLAQIAVDPADPGATVAAGARAWALAEAGRLRQRQGDIAGARQLLVESLSLATQAKSADAEACARLYLGELALDQGDSTAARSHLLTGLALVKGLAGHAPAACRFLHWLGHVAEADERPDEAVACYAEARELAASRDDAFFQAVATRGLASAAIEQGDLPAARHLLRETVALSRQVENATVDNAVILTYFARLAAVEGHAERAMRLAGAASALLDETGTHLFRHDRELLERRLQACRRLLTPAAAAAADTEGRRMGRERSSLLLEQCVQAYAPSTRTAASA